jgi:hypothetical protein
MRLTPVDTGHRIEIPADWARELGLERVAALERTPLGILVSPYSAPQGTWDEIFAEKLAIGLTRSGDDGLDLNGDDLLF